MDDRLSLDALRTRLSAAVSAGVPFSIIRLGDGEGRVMGYPEHVPSPLLADIWRTWFGHTAYREAQVAALREALREACRAADVIGVPQAEPYLGSEFGRVAALLAREGSIRPGTALCHAGFHLWFERHGWYAGLLAGLPEVGVIGPRDLTRVLPDRFGIGRVHWLPTPPEMRFADLPDAEAATLARRDAHLTTRLPELLDDGIPRLMRRYPGLVVLVGAGLPGKLYCARVKVLGGVAIDLGSMMDLWAGLKTRENPVFVDLRTPLGSQPVQTQPLSFDMAGPAHRGFIEDVLHLHHLDEARFCKPLPREDATFFKALLPACGDDRSLALVRFTEAAVREAEICRQVADGAFDGMAAVGSVLHVASGWGRLTRALAQWLPQGRLSVSDERADARAWQARLFGTTDVPWPPPAEGQKHDLIVAGPIVPGTWTAEAWLDTRLATLHGLLTPRGILTFGLPSGRENAMLVEAALRRLRPEAPPTWARLSSAPRGSDDLYLVGGPDRDVTALRVGLPPMGGFESATILANGDTAFAGWAAAPGDRIARLTVAVDARLVPGLRPAMVPRALGSGPGAPVGWRFSLPTTTPPNAIVRLRIEGGSGLAGYCYATASGQFLT
ncbi:hypothetical protein ASG40_17350 [Methylobacterium sp. Leaf399]|uniref:GT-D fold domain-containing protein n=1 Tax=Methylobacterium sp. Leaf399 TaxID=1736364 RepID=UPI0006F31175|nr:hypothetical protein [Methylobacterium sp. Leaf399]KQT17777.1 hypothetical protein ASG40_17350 [Methylobacterium sp. Leaf399]